MTPQGRPFTRLSARTVRQPRLALICGRYEASTSASPALATDEISMGDFVLTAASCGAGHRGRRGAAAAGRAGDPTGAEDDSHASACWSTALHPAQFRDWRVPDILLSGDHARIDRWRREEAVRRTFLRRPDMLLNGLTEEDRCF